MKRLLLAISVVVLLVSCAPKLDTPRQLAEAICASLQEGDMQLWLHCFLQEDDITWLDDRVRLSNDENPADYRPLADLTTETPPQYTDTFEQIHKTCEEMNLAGVTLVEVELGEEIESSWVPAGVRMLDSLTMRLESGDKLLELRFYDIVKTPRGWLVSNPIYRLQKETR